MADYKIVKLSQFPPRAWSFPDKKTGEDVAMETHKVMLEGIDEPVDLNRKPGKTPTVGEVLTGTLETTDFGHKFKPDRKLNSGFTPKDQESIRAEWAINAALQAKGRNESGVYGDYLRDIETYAKKFYVMVDRVKDTAVEAIATQANKITPESVKETFGDGTPLPDPNEPINLDEIPF